MSKIPPESWANKPPAPNQAGSAGESPRGGRVNTLGTFFSQHSCDPVITSLHGPSRGPWLRANRGHTYMYKGS